MMFALFLKIIIAINLSKDVYGTTQNDVSEPTVVIIEDKTMDPIILECDYDIHDTNLFLTVKWFKNNKTIYQWILGQSPSVIPEFKDEVDNTYETSEDPFRQYSNLALINPSLDTTGIYKCVVQTGSEIHTVVKRIQVIDIRNHEFELRHHKIQNETQLECTVVNVFPEPIVTITTDDDDEVSIVSTDVVKNEDGYFNSTTIAATYDDDDDPDVYKCTISFGDNLLNLTTTALSTSSSILTNNLLLILAYLCYFL